MKKYIVLGIVLLFFGLAISPSIYADKNEVSLESKSDNDAFDYDDYTPIQLVFLLINRFCNHKDIQDIKSEDDVLQIIEEDSELNDIIVKLKNFDCGCEDESNLKWSFPIICLLLSPLIGIFIVFRIKLRIDLPYDILMVIGLKLNCFWA